MMKQDDLTGWQAFEAANKYYVICIGILWIIGALAMLTYKLVLDIHASTQDLSVGSVFLLAGFLVLFAGIKSKISGLEES